VEVIIASEISPGGGQQDIDGLSEEDSLVTSENVDDREISPSPVIYNHKNRSSPKMDEEKHMNKKMSPTPMTKFVKAS
jgi:hypothetical protein